MMFESLSCQDRVARRSLSNLIASPNLIKKFRSDTASTALLSNLIAELSSTRRGHDI